MKRNTLHRLKSLGYSTSSASVLLLAAVSLDGALKSGILTLCLIAGVVTSIMGMFLRWLTYEMEKRNKAATDSRRGP